MDYEEQALQEANLLSDEQYESFLQEIERIPGIRAPISGKTARLLYEFMEDTGARTTEAINTRKKDLDYSTRIWTVVRPKVSAHCKCSKWKYADLKSRRMVLEKADKKCEKCHGSGRWKKPQYGTFTYRIFDKLHQYTDFLEDDDFLFPVSRQSVWSWGKQAGKAAGINIFQKKDERIIKGVFPHLFRALCSKRMVRDAKDDLYTEGLLVQKRRDAVRKSFVADRYTKIDIMYLLGWENKTYPKIL